MRETGIVPALCGAPLHDHEGRLVGTVEDLLVDAWTQRPVWLVVQLAGDAPRRTVIPATGSRPTCAGRRTRFTAAMIEACPVTLHGASVDREHAVGLARHYGLGPVRADACVPVCGSAVPEPGAVAPVLVAA